ncbi:MULTISPECIES: histidine phosphatase family protein [Clostridium]|uniref:histidine phosphatase family protein n=1 Tax=Clostridium TaxID=1485 RepID=UPI00069D43DD|nr:MULTISPECIES: histidine phosphatase family protein [Clostridium]KOF56599.1 phosphoglycerate kinase [Clostridium sp. DMHC 10]MCD2345602.1 histidine phosphatase family protein [Clostridium guangxiense]
MKTTLYLVRHGETEWNALGKFQGSKDIVLSPQGINQAQYVSNRLKDKFDYIYSSPLKRAYKTASIIALESNKEAKILNNLREIDFGDWEGFTVKEIKAKFPKEFEIWRSDTNKGPICGGELSIKNATIRSRNAILSTVEKHKGKRIVMVAHGGIIKAGLIGIFEWNMTMYHKIILGNTSICQLNFNDKMQPTIVTLNDTTHLPDEYEAKSYV